MHLSLKTEQDITPQNLRKLETMLADGNSMVLNHAEWCGHCNNLKPHWNSFKQTQSAKNINVIEVESRALQALESNPKIYTKITPRDKMVYFPMIIVFIRRKGKITKVFYKGNKTSSDLTNFVDKKMEPSRQQSPGSQQQESPKSPYPSPSSAASLRPRAASPKPRAASRARVASPSPKPRAASRAASPRTRAASPSPKPRAPRARVASRAASPKPRAPRTRAASPSPKPRAAPRAARAASMSPPRLAKEQDDDVFMSLYDLNKQLDNYINKYG
jgi:hypothetical protein